MAILELTLAYTFANQQCINRWNYISGGTPAAVTRSFGLVAAFGGIYDEVAIPPAYPADTVLGKIMSLLSDQVVLQQITALNVYDPVDFYQTPFVNPYNGDQSGDSLSPMVAYGFRSNQVRRDVARGTKRFAGVLEAFNLSGGILTTDALGVCNTIAEYMSDVISYDDEGNTLTYTPSICGKEAYDPNPPPATGNHRAYKYYATEAEQLDHTAIGVLWQAYAQTRSQVSRQYGHGR